MEIDTLSCGAAEIIRRQLNAYNARDIKALMAYWAPDVEVYAWPDTLLALEAEAIRTRHVERFKEPDLFARLISRVGLGGLVIDREVVTRNFPEGRGTLDIIGIYELEGDKIKRAWFRQGTLRLTD